MNIENKSRKQPESHGERTIEKPALGAFGIEDWSPNVKQLVPMSAGAQLAPSTSSQRFQQLPDLVLHLYPKEALGYSFHTVRDGICDIFSLCP